MFSVKSRRCEAEARDKAAAVARRSERARCNGNAIAPARNKNVTLRYDDRQASIMAAPAVGIDLAAITISAIWIVQVRLYERCLVVLSVRLARNDLENSNETLVSLRIFSRHLGGVEQRISFRVP